MLICHVINSLSQGGAEEILVRLVTFQSNVRHLVISLESRNDFSARLCSSNVEVVCLNLDGSFSEKLQTLFKLSLILLRSRPSLVQTWMYKSNVLGGIAAKLLTRCPIVWGIHNLSVDYPRTRTRAIIYLSAFLSRILPNYIIFCSTASLYAHTSLGYPKKKSLVIHNGTPLDVYKPSKTSRVDARHRLGIHNDDVIFGMVARCDPIKGHSILIDALRILISNRCGIRVKCLLVGRHLSESTWISSMTKLSGVEESIIIVDDSLGIPFLLNAMDFFCLSSFSEAFPLSLCEAMASSLPAISTDVGDCALIVGDTGWVVPPNDPELFARAMKSALDDQQYQSRQTASRQRISDYYSIDICYHSYFNAWSRAINNSSL